MTWQHRRLRSGIDCLWLDTPADRPLPAHWLTLERTADLIPVAHRSVVRHIELRGHRQSPENGGGSDQAAHIIRLSDNSLRASYNREYVVTLLHEFGHHVDWNYGVSAFARRQGSQGRVLLNTRHVGATHGDGEQIADCYMIYLLQVLAGHRYHHPADPAAYRGAAARQRFEILLASPAFNGLPGYRDWQSSA